MPWVWCPVSLTKWDKRVFHEEFFNRMCHLNVENYDNTFHVSLTHFGMKGVKLQLSMNLGHSEWLTQWPPACPDAVQCTWLVTWSLPRWAKQSSFSQEVRWELGLFSKYQGWEKIYAEMNQYRKFISCKHRVTTCGVSRNLFHIEIDHENATLSRRLYLIMSDQWKHVQNH